MFIGRKDELKKLEEFWSSAKSELLVLYGRRRIGKSSLIKTFASQKNYFYKFEAIESNRTSDQIKHFTEVLKKQTKDPLLDSLALSSWEKVLTYFTERVLKTIPQNKKCLVFFDELQWMAVGRSHLISMIKYFWDNDWKDLNVMIVLCGSVASFMVNKVIKSKALYGRLTGEMLLKGLPPHEAQVFLRHKRSSEEILKYLLVFGGIPKYLEQIHLNKSFNQNINELCFSPEGLMLNEIDRIFYSHFRETQTYRRISILLNGRMMSLNEISRRLKIPSGGGLNLYIQNLENAEILNSYIPFDSPLNTKFKKYTLADEYLVFYFRYIEPHLKTIKESRIKTLFELATKDTFDIWMGFAFERFCLKHAAHLAALMGFDHQMLAAAPYFTKTDNQFQIDLVFKRADKVITVCEIKYHNKEIPTSIIPEMERKCALFRAPRGYALEKALISLYGPSQSLRNSSYFHHSLTLSDILR